MKIKMNRREYVMVHQIAATFTGEYGRYVGCRLVDAIVAVVKDAGVEPESMELELSNKLIEGAFGAVVNLLSNEKCNSSDVQLMKQFAKILRFSNRLEKHIDEIIEKIDASDSEATFDVDADFVLDGE